jgi:MFS family permease
VFFRVLQGLGGGGLMTLSQALIGETIAPRERARYQGYLAAVVVFSNSFGPIAGGWLTQGFGWRSIFWLNLPLGLLALILAKRLPSRAPTGQPWHFDAAGLFFFVLFVVPALLVLEQIRDARLNTLPLLGGMAVLSAVSAWLLVRQESREASPLLPVSVWQLPAIWRSDALAACHGATLVSLITYVPIYLHVVRGVSATETGYILLPVAVGIGFGSLVTGRLVSRTGRTAIFPSIGLIPVALLLAILVASLDRVSLLTFAIILGVICTFLGSVMGVVQVTVQNAAPPGMLGSAAGSVQFSRAVGAAFGTALSGVVLFATLGHLSPEALTGFGTLMDRGPDAFRLTSTHDTIASALDSSFRMVFLMIELFAIAALGFAWSIPARRL